MANEVWYLSDGTVFDPVDPIDSKELYGFVYEIRNLISGRRYIGKKFFFSKKTKIVKGKKKKTTVENDWRKYRGSNDTLHADIKELGIENFSKTIIHLCKSKSECAYYETYEHFRNNAILDKNFYNDWLSCKITRKHLQAHADRMLDKNRIYFFYQN